MFVSVKSIELNKALVVLQPDNQAEIIQLNTYKQKTNCVIINPLRCASSSSFLTLNMFLKYILS